MSNKPTIIDASGWLSPEGRLRIAATAKYLGWWDGESVVQTERAKVIKNTIADALDDCTTNNGESLVALAMMLSLYMYEYDVQAKRSVQ